MIYHILKMPRFKRATAAHRANQAKKRKRNQREDPVRRQEEQECNTATRQLLHEDNPERREQEQQRNAEARRQLQQQNPERRQEEQEHDAIGNSIIIMNKRILCTVT